MTDAWKRRLGTWSRGRVLVMGAAMLMSTSAFPQLPPEIEIDRLLLRAERHGEEGEHGEMLALLDEVLVLADQHGIEVPVDSWFLRAAAANRTRDYTEALESVTRYLQEAGREGVNYREALELMNLVEDELEREKEEAAEEMRWRSAAEQIVREMEFVRIPPGTFAMGSSTEEGDLHRETFERPVTQVRIDEEFWLGKYKVTWSEWEAVMKPLGDPRNDCSRCPAYAVRDEIWEFLRRLNLVASRDWYGLPTEAEWEYAARAGTTGDWYGPLDEIAWYSGNREDSSHAVGQKRPNAWGLYDVLGNGMELTTSPFGAYRGGHIVDQMPYERILPEARAYYCDNGTAPCLVMRGCFVFAGASDCRLSYRMGTADEGFPHEFRLKRLPRSAAP